METDGHQKPIYGGRRDFQEGLGNIGGEFAEELNIFRQPDRQHDLETF
jgi:hypothetical protein